MQLKKRTDLYSSKNNWVPFKAFCLKKKSVNLVKLKYFFHQNQVQNIINHR